jgi:hypothetical protein
MYEGQQTLLGGTTDFESTAAQQQKEIKALTASLTEQAT